MAPVPQLPLQPGDVVAAKYRIDRVAGVGGMGAVLIAHHEELGNQVAIKLLLPSFASHPDAAWRFRREARAAAGLKSDHVVRVFDVDALDDGTPYMVMEYLEGDSLDAIIERSAPLPVEEAVDYAVQALLGLVEAHAAGIVHRDLKPQNIFVERHGGRAAVKVLDFGIAKVLDDSSSGTHNSTETDAFFGTPAYMSPEQIVSSKEVDGRADLWSLGVVLFEMLTKRLVFEASTHGAMLAAILNAPVPRLRDVRPALPAELDRILGKCLERDREARYGTAGELVQALASYAHESTRATVLAEADTRLVAPTGSAAPNRQPITALSWHEGSGRGTRRVQLAAGALAVGVAVGLAGWWVGARGTQTPASPVDAEGTASMSDLGASGPARTAPTESPEGTSSAGFASDAPVGKDAGAPAIAVRPTGASPGTASRTVASSSSRPAPSAASPTSEPVQTSTPPPSTDAETDPLEVNSRK